MIWLVGMASTLLCGYAMLCTGLEATALIITCRIVLLLAANIMLWIASDRYEKLKSRIKALEDKLKDREELK